MVAANHPFASGRRDDHCDPETLVALLDETLPDDVQRLAEDHLSTCDDCRERLEGMAADEGMWVETRSIYSEQAPSHGTSAQASTAVWSAESAHRSPPRHEAAAQWVRAISESDDEGQSLGRIDRYRIDAVIGTGGMGVVVAAWDEQLARPVAIKFLAPHLAGLSVARRRFAREARAVAAIIHPAIMPIYGVNEDSHPPYLVMPLVGSDSEGRSLQDRIDQQGPLPLEDALGVAAQVAEGLAAAHARGVIHRDIKPGNILCEAQSPRVMISDFGLARAIDDATVTVSGMVAGTPQYMSPEQASGEKVSPQSDLFSLGAVLYAMLTARPPFVAESPIAVLRQVIDTSARPASERVETLPPWVDHLIDGFLSKEPGGRFPGAGAAAEVLRQAEAHVRNPSHHPLPATLTSRRRSAWSRLTSPLGLTLTVATALAVIALLSPIVPGLNHAEATRRSDASRPQGAVEQSAAGEATPGHKPLRGEALGPVPTTDQSELSWDWNEFEWETEQIRMRIESIDLPLPPSANPVPPPGP